MARLGRAPIAGPDAALRTRSEGSSLVLERKVVEVDMNPKIPIPERECVSYEDLVPLYGDLRHIVLDALGDRYHPVVRVALDGFGLDEEFERDSALREKWPKFF